MRLHRLEVTAFGPFAGTAAVDFDALGAAGLFLLSGATGAGKTSVLDAVCFALYGAVPGDRNDAKRLRSDQADPSTAPRVELEATLAGRRFRIVRGPAWSRPKRRGTGTTAQQASVSISERVAGTWRPLSTRLDETGHLVTGLVGMNLTQFTQVAMLPQGGFQAFLRASSEDRHRLLQQLFHTGRFEQVERWLRERRLSLHHAGEEHRRTVDSLAHRVSETAGVPLPQGPDPDEPVEAASDGPDVADPAGWAAALAGATAELASAHGAALAGQSATEGAARQALEAARSLAEHRARHAAAATERAGLNGRADEVARLRERIDRAVRARPVRPLLRVVSGARRAHERALAAERIHRGAVAPLLDAPDDEPAGPSVERLRAETMTATAAVRALLPREAERAALTGQREALLSERQPLAGHVADLTATTLALPEELARLRVARADAADAAARLPAAGTAVAAATERVVACRRLHAVRNDLVAAQLDLNAVVTLSLGLAEELVALHQARVEGMAAEIAHGLAVAGGSCPVCGSEQHPHLAQPAPDAPDAGDERSLRRRRDDVELERHARAEHARDLETAAAVAEQAAGTDDVEVLQHRLATATATAGSLASRAEPLPRLDAELAATEARAAEAARDLTAATARLADLDARLQELAARITDVNAVLDEALGADGGDLTTRLADLDRTLTALTTLRDAAASTAAARRSLDDAERALADWAVDAGFADPDTAVAAALDDDQVAELRKRVTDHDRRLAATAAVLDDTTYAAAAAAPPPDVPALTDAHERAARILAETRAAELRERDRAERLAELAERLREAVAAWAPVRSEHQVVAGLAAFAEGKSTDNRLQMRLSAYVLAFRLSQVVDAANARLATMSDRRYSLEHTGRRGTGERRGGLSLLVRDDWSGESRDPATLSGGETFVVSLALALGLADVITHEVGGAALDTLFVDEGFGSLDADTLDDVMDTLDSLRDGGRVVGVVSHVAEMRDRIPTQLVVTKARSGSTVSLRT